MKHFKKWFQEKKKRLSQRPPDEIDCGMGYYAALKNIQQWIMSNKRCTGKDVLKYIDKELED